MYTIVNAAVYVLYGLLAVNLGFALLLYVVKLRNIRIRKTRERFPLKYRDYLVYLQTNLDGEERLRVPPVKMNRIERESLQERIHDMIEAFSGEARDKLIDLCEQLGFVRLHLRRLQSRSYRRNIDAAYHLGCMRVQEAAPALLELLRRHKFDSSLFVVARAAAKCARNEKDVKEMVHILLQQRKSFPELIADIVEEARIDHASLFVDFIRQEQPALVRIGFTGLKEMTNPSLSAAAYRWLDSRNEDIQRKAIEVYLKSSAFLPRNVANKLLDHADADIRLLTVRTCSELNPTAYMSAFLKSLKDPDPRVVHAGAMGLFRQGQEGMELFCQTAKDVREQGLGTQLQDLIEEELASLSNRLESHDHLTRYNALLYTYEKTFGRNKRIYRVV